MNDNIWNFGVQGSEPDYYQDIDTSNTVDGKPIYYWTSEKNAPNNCKNLEIDETSNAGLVTLVSCRNITVKNLNLRRNFNGILLVNTTNSKVLNNTVTSNGYQGVSLDWDSSNNALANNTVNSNGIGISLEFSSNNTLRNNTMNDNTLGNFEIWGWGDVSYYYQDIDTSNKVDGKPVYYLTSKNAPNNCRDFEINNTNEYSNAGLISLISCDNITVKNLNLHDNGYGILLVNTTNSKVLNNTVNYNIVGIHLFFSSNNIIKKNIANSNDNEGISLWYSSNNTISNNIANSNYLYGIFLDHSSNNDITNNNLCFNTDSDFYLYSSSGNQGDENTCDRSGGWNDTGTTGCTYSCSGVTIPTTTTTTTTITTTSTTTITIPLGDLTISDIEPIQVIANV